MALTKITSASVKDNELVNADLHTAANIDGSKLADDSISLAKLEHGTSSNNGKFLRANNGADPSFETVDLANLSASNLTSGTIPDARFPTTLPAVSGANLTGVSSPEVYGFNTSGSQLQVTTTNGGADNIDATTYASFDDVVFAATGFTFSLDTTTGNLVATI